MTDGAGGRQTAGYHRQTDAPGDLPERICGNGFAAVRQTTLMFSARGPFGPWAVSNVTA